MTAPSDATFWFKADSLALADTDPVDAWTNEITAANWVQATGSAQPTYRTNQLKGLPGVVFDGGDYLVGTDPTVAGPLSLFVVARGTSDLTNPKTIIAANSAGNFNPQVRIYQSRINLLAQAQADLDSSDTNLSLDTDYLLEVYHGGGASMSNDIEFYVDQSADGTGSWSGQFSASTFRLGTNSGVSESFQGTIYELILFDSALSETERDDIRAYLYDRWFAPTPVAPTDPSATALSSSSIRVDWTDASSDETGFRVERSPNGSTGWTNASGSLDPGTETYTDTGLTASTTYYYRVYAFNGSGDSSASTTVNATTTAGSVGDPFDDVDPEVGVGLGSGPFAASPTFTDIRDYLSRITIRRGRSSLLSRFDTASCTIRLDNTDGRFDPANTAGPYYPDLAVRVPAKVVVTQDTVDYTIFYGIIEQIPLAYDDGAYSSWVDMVLVDLSRVLAMWDLTGVTLTTGYSGAQVGEILDEVGWPAGLRSVDAGTVRVPGRTCDDGESALDAIASIVAAEFGHFFVAADGTATFADRAANFGGATSQATFGPGASELGYEQIEIAYDDDTLFNAAVAQGDNVDTQTAVDATSIASYGKTTINVSSKSFLGPTYAKNVAEWWPLRHKDVRVRIRGLTLKPQFDESNMWPQALGRELRDVVTVKFTPPSGDALNQACSIERIDHDVDASGYWITRWTLQPLAAAETLDYWIVGTSEMDSDTRIA